MSLHCWNGRGYTSVLLLLNLLVYYYYDIKFFCSFSVNNHFLKNKKAHKFLKIFYAKNNNKNNSNIIIT